MRNNHLFSFYGGVKPKAHKESSTHDAVLEAPLPKQVILPMLQHMGKAAIPIVTIGQHVLRGEIIGRPDSFLSSTVHASISGEVIAIEERAIAHPSNLPSLCVVIKSDEEDRSVKMEPVDWQTITRKHAISYLQTNGVVGLGGAAFPSHAKLDIKSNDILETLLINGAECEPFMTCDDMLMREQADEIINGSCILGDILKSKYIVIGVEDNKPEAITALNNAVIKQNDTRLSVVVVPTVYPAGGAKQLIRVITGHEIPHGKRAYDFGIQCFNVATAQATYKAFRLGNPLISRIVTVTGAVKHPRNIHVRLGTLVEDLLALCGGTLQTASPVVMGGPMMGFNLEHTLVPITKSSNCILVGSTEIFAPAEPEMPCIRCGECALACPAQLQPQSLYWFARAKEFEKARDYHLFDCIECGCCAYVCPSHIPLVAYYRFAKSEIVASDHTKKLADTARERHDFRIMRLAREKSERAARLAKKAAKATSENAHLSADEKKEIVQAAIERTQTSAPDAKQ